MTEKIRRFWDRQATSYDRSERQFDPAFERILADTRRYCRPTDTALDVGCATGTKTLQLAGSVGKMTGIDISPAMVKAAQEKATAAGIGNAGFVRGTVHDRGFADGSFDVVVSYGVIHLLQDAQETVRRVHTLLKPGGLFISSTACLRDRMGMRTKLIFSGYMVVKALGLFPLHLNMMTPDDVEGLMHGAGFELVESRRILHGITISFIAARRAPA